MMKEGLKLLKARAAKIVGSALLFYLGSVFVVFDFTEPALKFDEENVAVGPRPRWLFCQASYADFFYTGHEWPFAVYAPFCQIWRYQTKYPMPSF